MSRRLLRSLLTISAIYLSIGHLLAFVIIGDCQPYEGALGVHQDYYFSFFRGVPRKITTRCLAGLPILLLGNQDYWRETNQGFSPKPIPRRGEWQLSVTKWRKNCPIFLPYFSFTTTGGIHFRIGSRWDDMNGYFTIPSLALKFPSEENLSD